MVVGRGGAERGAGAGSVGELDRRAPEHPVPGKQTLTMSLPPLGAEPAKPVQMQTGGAVARPVHSEQAQETAAQGVSGASQPLPHASTIQHLFGRHDVSNVKAQVGGAAAVAADRLGADAYATGRAVAFRGEPDLHTAAHEAAHTVQQAGGVQLAGGVGRAGDAYERHADEVAEAVVAGRSAERLLDRFAGAGSAGSPAVQKKDGAYDTTQYTNPPLPKGYTLANITSELKKKQTAKPPGITSWSTAGVTAGSTEEIYVLYAVWELATPDHWGTEVDTVTEVGPGKKGAIQVKIDAKGNAVGTLVAAAAPTVAATFKTAVAAIAALKKTYDLTDIKGEKGQAWKVDQLNKLSAAWGRLGGAEAAALSKYTVLLTDNTLTGPDGKPANGLTTRDDKTSADGLSAIKTREIRFNVDMFDADLTSFVGDSTNAAPASFLTLTHEAAHAQASKVLDDANAAEVAAQVATNKVIGASNRANAKTVSSRNTAVVGKWNKFSAADQTASKPLVDAFDAAHTAITAFRDETDTTKMAALEAPALAAIKARDAAKAAVPAKNPAHAAFGRAITDQDAYLKVVEDLLAKRQAQSAAASATAATKDPTGAQSKRLQAFVDFVTANKIDLDPVTKYAKDNWPARAGEFYAEAFSLWRNDPTFFGTYSPKLKKWFDDGEHLK
jgi:hypothetical protein